MIQFVAERYLRLLINPFNHLIEYLLQCYTPIE